MKKMLLICLVVLIETSVALATHAYENAGEVTINHSSWEHVSLDLNDTNSSTYATPTHLSVTNNGWVESLYTYHNSTATMTDESSASSIFAYNTTKIIVTDNARINDYVAARGDSTVTMNGNADGNVSAYDNAAVSVYDNARFSGALHDNATLFAVSDTELGAIDTHGNSSALIQGNTPTWDMNAHDNSVITLRENAAPAASSIITANNGGLINFYVTNFSVNDVQIFKDAYISEFVDAREHFSFSGHMEGGRYFSAFGNIDGGDISIHIVPEPMTLYLLALGGIASVRRHRA